MLSNKSWPHWKKPTAIVQLPYSLSLVSLQSWPPIRLELNWFSLCLFSVCCVCVPASLQNLFLTQQCLNQELTLDLLEKYRNPEKLKTCLVTEDDEMEVSHDLTCNYRNSKWYLFIMDNSTLLYKHYIYYIGSNLTVDVKSRHTNWWSGLCPLSLFLFHIVSCCWFQVVVPGSLKRIQSINKHNRAERTNSDISCKKRCSLTHLWLLFDGIIRYFHDAEKTFTLVHVLESAVLSHLIRYSMWVTRVFNSVHIIFMVYIYYIYIIFIYFSVSLNMFHIPETGWPICFILIFLNLLYDNNGGDGNTSSFCCLLLKFLHSDSNVNVKNNCCA